MKLKGELWPAKGVDFDLAAFHCLVRALNRSLRNLLEASLSFLLLKDLRLAKLLPPHVQSPNGPVPSDFDLGGTGGKGTVASALPAFMLPRTCLGAVCKFFLEWTSSSSAGAAGVSFETALKSQFGGSCVDAMKDLKTGIKFFKEVLRCVTVIYSHMEGPETEQIFAAMSEADALLEQKRKLVGL
jgi:hypothetical protein